MKKVSLLVIGLLTLSLNAYSAMEGRMDMMKGGSADTGGGNAVGDQLLDIYENDGATPINVTQTRAYQEVLIPIFKNLNTKVKFASTTIQSASTFKSWFLDPKPLTSKDCINTSMISVEKTIVGCQDQLEVRLFQPWFEGSADLKNQAALLMHEFVRAHTLKNKNMSDNTVKSLTRLLLNASNVSEQQLASALVEAGLATNVGPDALITGTEWLEIKNNLARVYLWNCGKGSDEITWYNDIFETSGEPLTAVAKYKRNLHNKLKAKQMTCKSVAAEWNN